MGDKRTVPVRCLQKWGIYWKTIGWFVFDFPVKIIKFWRRNNKTRNGIKIVFLRKTLLARKSGTQFIVPLRSHHHHLPNFSTKKSLLFKIDVKFDLCANQIPFFISAPSLTKEHFYDRCSWHDKIWLIIDQSQKRAIRDSHQLSRIEQWQTSFFICTNFEPINIGNTVKFPINSKKCNKFARPISWSVSDKSCPQTKFFTSLSNKLWRKRCATKHEENN